MPNYENGKIYRITSGNLTYIGSTTAPTLAKRLAQHVSEYKRWKKDKSRYVSSYKILDTCHYDITLIESCPCGSKDDLTARERYWIENMECVNKCIAGRTHNECSKLYNETHAEQYKEYQKAYRLKQKLNLIPSSAPQRRT